MWILELWINNWWGNCKKWTIKYMNYNKKEVKIKPYKNII